MFSDLLSRTCLLPDFSSRSFERDDTSRYNCGRRRVLRSGGKMLEFDPSRGKAGIGAGLGQRPLVFGHRGDSINHPENTLLAFEKALRAGADGVECDVRLSGDGLPVVFHDATLERTTNGSGRLADFSLQQLKGLDAGRGERIPTVTEAADLLRGRGLLCIEFKEAEAVAPTAKALADVDASEVVLCSFLPKALHACAESAPRFTSAAGLRFSQSQPDGSLAGGLPDFDCHENRRGRAELPPALHLPPSCGQSPASWPCALHLVFDARGVESTGMVPRRAALRSRRAGNRLARAPGRLP